MYNPQSLNDFLDQWTPEQLPIKITRIVYEFTEFIHKRVRVDLVYLAAVLKKYGYTADLDTLLVTRDAHSEI